MKRARSSSWSRPVPPLLIALPAAMAVLWPPALATAQAPPPTAVYASPVKLEMLEERHRVTGELRAAAHSMVATIEKGLVVALPVREGDAVAAGDVLARLDRRRMTLEVARAEARQAAAAAELAVRTAERERAARHLASLRALDEGGAARPKELDDAEADAAAAQARAEEARMSLNVAARDADLLRERLEDMTITAPFEGVVVARQTDLGQWLHEGDPVVELVSTGAYDAFLDVPERFAEAMIGTSALVQVRITATGQAFPPARPAVIPRVDPTARSFKVRVRLEDTTGTLAAGMSVTGWVPMGRRGEYLTIDRDALLRNDVGSYVYVAREGGQGGTVATPVPVEVLFEVGSRITVRSPGLTGDDWVVVEGNERLHPMMPITVVRDTSEERDAAAGEHTGAERAHPPNSADGGG